MWKTKDICITAMGVALFVALSMCLRVPVFENYYLCLGYIVMAVYCYSFGAVKGTIVGVMGTVLYCLLINGLRGMPGWAMGNIAIGIFLGVWFKVTKKQRLNMSMFWYIYTSILIIAAVAFGILGMKSAIECILYAQPMAIRLANNVYAFVSDVVVLVASLPICKRVDSILRKNFSLLEEK